MWKLPIIEASALFICIMYLFIKCLYSRYPRACTNTQPHTQTYTKLLSESIKMPVLHFVLPFVSFWVSFRNLSRSLSLSLCVCLYSRACVHCFWYLMLLLLHFLVSVYVIMFLCLTEWKETTSKLHVIFSSRSLMHIHVLHWQTVNKFCNSN